MAPLFEVTAAVKLLGPNAPDVLGRIVRQQEEHRGCQNSISIDRVGGGEKEQCNRGHQEHRDPEA